MSENVKSFSVLPMGQNITLKRGETYEGEVSIAIPSDAAENFSYVVDVSPYSIVDGDYTADLVNMGVYTQIVNWIKIEEPKGEIEPNGVKKIHFKIEVPEDAPVGGQYAALMVGQNADEIKNDGIAIQNLIQIASVIYANVEGEIVKSGEILENNIPVFSFNNDITIGSLIKNDGNTHLVAGFKIKATNLFTGQVIFPSEDEEMITEVIMPGSMRNTMRKIENLPMLGVVHISQEVDFNGKVSKNEQNVIICPIWFIILVLASVVAIIMFIISRIRAHKKRSTLVY